MGVAELEREIELLPAAALSVYRRHRLPAWVDVDDLAQDGWFGLARAAARHDPSRGVTLGAYAAQRVRGAMLDGLRERDWVPRLARQRGEPVPRVRSASAGPGDRAARAVADPKAADPAAVAAERDGFDVLACGLPDRLRRVVERHYRDGWTFARIGSEMGLGKSQVYSLHGQALAILRERHGVEQRR